MMKQRTIFNLIIVSMLFSSLSACKQISQSVYDTLHGRPKISKEDAFFNSKNSSSNAANFLTDAGRLAQAEQALKNIPDLKGKVINVFDDLHLYDDGRIMLKVQDPDTLENINEYDYSSTNEEWGPKQPVKVGNIGVEVLRNATIPLDSIHFKTVAKMASAYADSAKSKGSTTRLNHIYYVQGSHRWYCNDIEGTRSNYQLYFNPDGTVKEFTKH